MNVRCDCKGDKCKNDCIIKAIKAALPDGYSLNFDGIDFPTPLSQISKVEKQNGIAINVFGWNNKDEEVFVYRLSEQTEYKKKINLMLLEETIKFQCTWADNNVSIFGLNKIVDTILKI